MISLSGRFLATSFQGWVYWCCAWYTDLQEPVMQAMMEEEVDAFTVTMESEHSKPRK